VGAILSLLPGIRHVRAPLAAGYLWLAAAWFALHDRVPDKDDAHGAIEALYQAASAASGVATVLGLSFIAYIVGSLTETAATRLINLRKLLSGTAAETAMHTVRARLREIGDASASTASAEWWYEHGFGVGHAVAPGTNVEVRPYRRRDPVRTETLPSEEYYIALFGEGIESERYGVTAAEAINLAIRELPLAARRLVSEQPALYAEFDRLRAEAELRVAIAFPLVAAIISFAFVSAWPPETSGAFATIGGACLAALMLLVALLADGGVRFEAANDLLAELLDIGVVKLPSLERLHLRAVEDSEVQREAESRDEPT
jgi:hypothetical protein